MKKKHSVSFPVIVFVLLMSCSLQDEPANFTGYNENNYLHTELYAVDNAGLSHTKIKDVTKQSKYFRSKFKLWSDVIPVGPNFNITVYGTGNATHLGKVDLLIEEEVTIDENIRESSATVIVTSTNGDELHFSYHCNIDVSETPDFLFTGTCEITGGTGRFANAVGELEVKKIFNWYSQEGTVTFKGELSL